MHTGRTSCKSAACLQIEVPLDQHGAIILNVLCRIIHLLWECAKLEALGRMNEIVLSSMSGP